MHLAWGHASPGGGDVVRLSIKENEDKGDIEVGGGGDGDWTRKTNRDGTIGKTDRCKLCHKRKRRR
jgi:hypothetical protein